MTCEQAELSIGMRQHGALDAAGLSDLEAHLAGCASCRRFEDTTRRLETDMQSQTMDELSRIDWTRVETRMRKLHEENRHLLTRSLAMALVLTIAITWVTGGHSPADYVETATQTLAMSAILMAAFVLQLRRRRREEAMAGTSREGVLGFCRTQVDGAVQRTRWFRFLNPIFGVIWLVGGLRIHASGGTTAATVFFLGFGVLLIGWGVTTHFDYRRLLREQATLR